MKKGEIWLVKLDKDKSVGHEYFNDRPALIIMSDSLASAITVVTVIPITSSSIQGKYDIIIKKSKRNGLYQDSVIKVGFITSYDKTRFIHKIGEAEQSIIESVQIYLKKHFDLI